MAASISPARSAVFQILRKIGQQKGNSDTLLHSREVDRLATADRNLCNAIVLGTLRWQQVLDAECRKFLSRPGLPLPEPVELALRVGAYQMLLLDRIPAHAAIFESVEWVKQSEAARHAGLVNAVLRKLAASPKPDRFDAEKAYPDWMIARWRKMYGANACRKICEHSQKEQQTALRLLAPNAQKTLLANGVTLEPGSFLAEARYATGLCDEPGKSGPATSTLLDEGSQLVAELLGRGERILDCCAAPGGKTAVLRQNNPDAQMLICDSDQARLKTMQQRFGAFLSLGRTEFRVADAAKLANIGTFDRILCDVPCSGTGTLGRNPEIRHRIQPAEFIRQSKRQRAILSSALRLLAPGGRLLYSTCSLEPEENEQVVTTCLESTGGAGVLKRIDLLPEFERLERRGIAQGEAVSLLRAGAFCDGYLRTLPGVHPCDGFFAALIERS